MPRIVLQDGSASLGELLRDHRRAAGLTQEELAELAGVSPRSISELERGGAHLPRRDTIGLLARALGLSPPDRQLIEELVDQQRRARAPRLGQELTPAEPPRHQQRHNFPRLLTSIIGRERELRELATIVPGTPLLTLIGTGGVGKTRLAHELARELDVRYADGSWLVELSGLSNPSLVPSAVAAAVGLQDLHARNTMRLLTEYLSQQQLLLVLDNCEHLIGACADLVARLMRDCPRLHVLATSREPLGITGEVTWPVLPLEVPDPRLPLSPERITPNPAVRLFMERARAAGNALMVTDQNAPAIVRICIGVDGIPLALELAAARTRVLTVEELAERLDHDANILRAPSRAVLPQHRTMRSTIDWSHDLLREPEQRLLRRLAVFAGGWNLALAEEVCSGDGIDSAEVLDLLGQLVDKSMVMVDARDRAARYRLLEPIRQYAAEQLEASGEGDTFGSRHSEAVLRFALGSEAGAPGDAEITSLDRVEVEHDNLRRALSWALGHGRARSALVCAATLFRFWERRGHFQEGCAWLELALSEAVDATPRERGWALNALAFMYWRCGDHERALPIAEEALAVCREASTSRDIAQALLNLGMIAYFQGQPALAVERMEECVRFGREAGFPTQLCLGLTFLGRTRMRVFGAHDERARAVLEEGLQMAETVQSRYAIGHALLTRGDLVWQQGDVAQAVSLWRGALSVRSELNDRRGLAGALERLAWGMVASEHYDVAAWLFGASEAQHRALGIDLRHDERKDHAELIGRARKHLGDAFGESFSAGRAATLDDSVARGKTISRAHPRQRERSRPPAREW